MGGALTGDQEGKAGPGPQQPETAVRASQPGPGLPACPPASGHLTHPWLLSLLPWDSLAQWKVC